MREWSGRAVEFVSRASAHVCALAYVRPQEMYSSSRHRRHSRARMVVWWILREIGMSYPKIGEAFRRHHTTVIHGVREVEESIAHGGWAADAVDLVCSQAFVGSPGVDPYSGPAMLLQDSAPTFDNLARVSPRASI